MGNAMGKAEAASAPKILAPSGEFFTDSQVRAEFAQAVKPYPRLVLAKAANRSKEGAKEWKDADNGRCPNLTSTLNMAVRLPRVRAYVLAKLGAEQASFESPQVLAGRIEALERLVAQSNEESRQLRRVLSGQSETEAKAARARFVVHEDRPEDASNYTPDGALGDLLERRA